MTNSLVQPLLSERRKNVKIVLSGGSLEKNAPAVTENVHLIEETIIHVEEMTESGLIGFVLHVETTILPSEQNAIVAANQSKETLASVAAHSETIAVVEDVMIVAVEDVMIEEVATKNNTIEMIGFAPHVRMTISLSEQNAINVVNLDQEDNPVEETEEVDATMIVEDVEETEEVDSAEDAIVIVEETEEADATMIVEDVEETEEVDSAEDAMVIVEDAEETEEVDSAEDAMVIVEDVEETGTAVVVMNAQVSNTEKLVENDPVMLTIDLLKKSNPVDISDVMTTITEVKE